MSSLFMTGKASLQMSSEIVSEIPDDLSSVDLVNLDCVTTSISYSGMSADEIEVTTLCSTAKEYAPGQIDAGELSFDGHYVPEESDTYKALQSAGDDRKYRLFVVTFENGSKFVCVGYISTKAWSLPSMSEVVTLSVTVKLSGMPKEILATVSSGTP